jgi:DnaK suppressor protein
MDDAAHLDHVEAERRATMARIVAMSAEFDEIVAATADSNADDEHDPEGSTVAFERAQVVALLNQARTYLDDLDRALARLAAGAYSECERCRSPIAAERLAARPAVRLCMSCATWRPRDRPRPT